MIVRFIVWERATVAYSTRVYDVGEFSVRNHFKGMMTYLDEELVARPDLRVEVEVWTKDEIEVLFNRHDIIIGTPKRCKVPRPCVSEGSSTTDLRVYLRHLLDNQEKIDATPASVE